MNRFRKISLSEIFNITDAVKSRKKEPYGFQCQNCGKNQTVDGNLVWRKYCDIKCYKEKLEENRRIKKILKA